MTRRIAIVTGTRAEFGLLRSTIAAVSAHPGLEACVLAGGAHLLPPAETIDEVRAAVDVAAEIEMQRPGIVGRLADARAVGRGTIGFAEALERLRPDLVLVLGDRIEAFAAATAAAVGGIALAHVHGGDRAEGVADEAMRHSISDLSDLHFAATRTSGDRLRRMGQPPESVFVVGSPAVDGLHRMPVLSDAAFEALGSPRLVVLHHGSGLEITDEDAWSAAVLDAAVAHGATLVVRPNHDPGSDRVAAAIDQRGRIKELRVVDHLPRPEFVGLLHRVEAIVGNSSAGLIEAAIVGCPAVNVGPRQAGRERPSTVLDVHRPIPGMVERGIESAIAMDRTPRHPYGENGVGERIAAILAECSLPRPRKRLAY
ncbi:MAG: UDP-N-acetylglucosamine 2-epimerase (hydrolyzing) [Planctomycetaceae bacterium]|nr:UDP-N-acetylglucosamine 2-epimerase (hydrolyzing) [Planctomycetaceae bacterium]